MSGNVNGYRNLLAPSLINSFLICFSVYDRPGAVVWSPDGSFYAIPVGHMLEIYSISSRGKMFSQKHDSKITCCQFLNVSHNVFNFFLFFPSFFQMNFKSKLTIVQETKWMNFLTHSITSGIILSLY